MNTHQPIFDTIQTSQKEYKGVIDYSNKKHVFFYDMTNNTDPDAVLVVISWRLTYKKMRFSVFKDIFFPNTPIDAILLPKKAIVNDIDTPDQTPIQDRIRVTKSKDFSSNSSEQQS